MNPRQNKRENLWVSMVVNILIPALILMKGSQMLERWDLQLPPAVFLTTALLFPICYGPRDFTRRGKMNFFSILGFTSILVTGSIGLLKLDKEWIAVKEAAVPAILGAAVMATAKASRPLVRVFLLNEQIFDVVRIEEELKRRGNVTRFNSLMVLCTVLLGASFFLSAGLNFVLARFLIRSPSGTDAFNAELGRMTIWSYPVIVIPCMGVMFVALWMLMRGIKDLTGFTLEEIVRHDESETGQDTKSEDAS